MKATPIRSRRRVFSCRRIRFVRAMILALFIGTAAMVHPSGAFAQPAPVAGDSSLIAFQQNVVAHLAGHPGAQRREGVVSRSTPAERAGAASYLADALAEIGLTPQRHDYRLPNVNGLVDLLLAPYRGTNVYTVVEATTPSTEYVVVGAHYDSVPGSPGAGDNAAGVAAVYALASRLSGLDTRRLNVLLVFFDQEEDDEVGSRAFVRYLRNKPYEVHSVHVTDLSGWDDDNDRAVVIQSPGPYLERHYREAADRLGIALYLTGGGGSSDNKSFLNAGYRTVGVFGDIARYVHKPTDTYEKVDFAFLASMTALMFEVLTDLVGGGPSDAR